MRASSANGCGTDSPTRASSGSTSSTGHSPTTGGRGGLSAAFADVEQLPFPDSSFDLVVAIEVFEHFADPDRALAELVRVGTDELIASVPLEPIWRVGNMVRGRYLRDLGNTPGHVNHWSRRGFSRFVAQRWDVTEVACPLPWTMVRARSR